LGQRSNILAACAFGTPMNASGAASARHRFTIRKPMAGSTSTGTAPSRARASTTAVHSGPGDTSRLARIPGRTPARHNAAAHSSTWDSISRKVTAA
jgi:hypothetical protein